MKALDALPELAAAELRDAIADALREWIYDRDRTPFPKTPGEIADQILAITREATLDSVALPRNCACATAGADKREHIDGQCVPRYITGG